MPETERLDPRNRHEPTTGTLACVLPGSFDCDNIYRHTEVPPGSFLEGFALIYALVELDVVSVYTAGHTEVEAFHTERVPARKLVFGTSELVRRLQREENLQ